jgi:hypothetical protein
MPSKSRRSQPTAGRRRGAVPAVCAVFDINSGIAPNLEHDPDQGAGYLLPKFVRRDAAM